jgi:hypothetical protein
VLLDTQVTSLHNLYPATGVDDITSNNISGFASGTDLVTTTPKHYSFTSGDYININDNALLRPNSITVITWAYKSDWDETSPVSQRLVSKFPNTGTAGWLQYLTADTGLFKTAIYVGNTRYEANINASDIDTGAGWHQIAFTYDGSSLKVYVDADLVQTNSSMSGNLDSSTINW